MNDKTIIENHLNNFYTLNLGHNEYYEISDEKFTLKHKYYEDLIVTRVGIVNEITSIFSIFLLDNNISINDFVETWFDEMINKTYDGILKKLENVQVIYGQISWEVKKNGVNYDVNAFIKEFENQYNPNILKRVFDEWKYREILKISDILLNS